MGKVTELNVYGKKISVDADASAGLLWVLRNAIFNATGVRLRSLPLAPRGLEAKS